jgi:hypothetical protein
MSNESDRELLELAAKVAGYEPVRYHAPAHGSGSLSAAWAGPWLEVGKPEAPLGNCRWNPLTNDGDALRLAVKLGIPFEVDYGVKEAIVRGRFGIDIGSDPYAATRRAIVRAAAEIGKAMP